MNELQKAAIDHYRRMQKWVKTQDQEEFPNRNKMFSFIGEQWMSSFCPYCLEYYYDEKKRCALEGKNNNGLRCDNIKRCCDGLWGKMYLSRTWAEWLIRSDEVIDYIKNFG